MIAFERETHHILTWSAPLVITMLSSSPNWNRYPYIQTSGVPSPRSAPWQVMPFSSLCNAPTFLPCFYSRHVTKMPKMFRNVSCAGDVIVPFLCKSSGVIGTHMSQPPMRSEAEIQFQQFSTCSTCLGTTNRSYKWRYAFIDYYSVCFECVVNCCQPNLSLQFSCAADYK